MLRLCLERVGAGRLRYEVNSVGCSVCRPSYRDALREHFSARKDMLCHDCLKRLELNPMRILDCKVRGCVEARGGVPVVGD